MATVLVVDDTAVSRELLRALLGYAGHRVLEAAEGVEGLALALREHPDVVITDVLMPGLDGYELARKLRGEPTTSRIPIAFYTAHYVEQEVLPIAEACGVQKVILKTSPPSVLIEAVESLLATAPTMPVAVTEEEFTREHVHALKAKLVEKAAALSQSEGRFRIIAEAAPVGILLGDDEGSAVYVNPCLTTITGRTADALLGERWLDYVEPARRAEILATVTAGPLDGSHRHRVRIGRADDRPLWLDVHLRPIAAGDDGQRAGFVGLFDDVTVAVEAEEHRQAEQEREAKALRRTAQLAHRLTEAQRVARLGTWDLDVETGWFTLSPELHSVLGSTLELTRAEVRHLAHPDDRARVTKLIARAIDTGEPFTDELRITRPDGALREIVVFGEPVPDHAGAATPVRKLWGVIQDITEVRVAQRTAEAARADWQAEHRVLERFQQAMLPTELPVVPGLGLAAIYIAAADRLDIGGDWYDVFRLPDGRILLSVGDVAGHDQNAAATMGPIRAALRAYAIEDPDPATALARLNRFIAIGYPSGTLITAVVGVYDPETQRLNWANAGHPAPMLATATPRAQVRVLADHGIALGATDSATYSPQSVIIPPGAALCCYTDGLLERRFSSGDVDHARLLRVVGDAFCAVADRPADSSTAAHRLVATITAQMLNPSPPEDDVCLLVLWTPAG